MRVERLQFWQMPCKLRGGKSESPEAQLQMLQALQAEIIKEDPGP